MSKSIGIDLGTTNSVVAIKKVQTEVLENAEGELITPSCVFLAKKKKLRGKPSFVVGRHALEWMKQEPESTVVAVKRLMGRSISEPEVQKIIAEQRLRYQVAAHSRGTENSLAIVLRKKEYLPEEISAQILAKLRADACRDLGDAVDFAVITVPAYFNDKQKHATRTAAALAGLKISRLLPEPTAAAISFGVDDIGGDEARTVMVFDLGGGTFDLSVLTISGGQFIEQGKGGDMWLGGAEIDRAIVDHVLAETARDNQIEDIVALIARQKAHTRNRFLSALEEAAEKAKIALSTNDEAFITVLGLLEDEDGDRIDIDVTLTREQLETLIAPVVESVLALCRRLLDDTHLTTDLIDQVLLVGGSSQIPKIVDALRKEFGAEKVLVHPRPMLAIAEGAAVLSHRLADSYECPQCTKSVTQSETTCPQCGFDLERHTVEAGVVDIVHAAAHDYSIRLENGERHLLVGRNTPLPCEHTDTFALVHPDQRLVHMKFSNLVNDVEESIGDLWLGIEAENLDEHTKNDARLHVELTVKIDENNLVEVSAGLEELPDVKVSKTLSRGKADEKLFVALETLIADANRAEYKKYVMLDLEERSLSAIRDIHRVVDDDTGEVDAATYDQADLKIDKARRLAGEDKVSKPAIYYGESALASFEPAIAPDKRKLLKRKIEELEEADERGSYAENVEAIDRLHDVLHDLGAVNVLMNIQKAARYCDETEPARASKFHRAIDDILEAFRTGDAAGAHTVMDRIMPGVQEIVVFHDDQKVALHTELTK